MSMFGMCYRPDNCDHAKGLVAYVTRSGQTEVIVVDCPTCNTKNPVPPGAILKRRKPETSERILAEVAS